MLIILIMISIIRYKEIEKWNALSGWIFVYGRRKTGKSFFVKNFVKWDRYFLIGRGREIFEDTRKIPYDAFVEILPKLLKENKTVVIDEIQRLPDEFQDLLHASSHEGNLIAISSTLFMARKLLGAKSPLLGLFLEFKMGLIDERDILINLSKHIRDPRNLVEVAVYLREPWLVHIWENNKEKFFDVLLSSTRLTVPALMGEIFKEEDKELTSMYEGVLKAIADGKRVSGAITNYLYSMRLISAQNPSLVHPYLKILRELGMLEKIKVFGKKKYFYYHTSPLTDLFYYLDAKYGFGERDVSDEQLKRALTEKLPLHVEQFFRNLLAGYFGLWKEIIVGRDYEIDIALTDFHKLKVVAEVKWKNRVSREEIRKIEDVLNKFNCKRILIVPNRDVLEREPEGIEVWDVGKILEMI